MGSCEVVLTLDGREETLQGFRRQHVVGGRDIQIGAREHYAVPRVLHKAGLLKAIKVYLDALASRRPGRPVTKDSLEKRLTSIQERLTTEEDTLKRVDLHQSRIEIEEALLMSEDSVDMAKMEAAFAKVASAYSDRKGISYGALAECRGPCRGSQKAGVARSTRQA